jgi:50S ribosomal subunit-associated GTPase HflX
VDRFAVILEIFDLRAESKEAKLQVKLAHLK